VIPEGDFSSCLTRLEETTVKAEANATVPRSLNFAAITARNHIYAEGIPSGEAKLSSITY